MLVICNYPVGRDQCSCSNVRRGSTYSDWLNVREYTRFSTNGLAGGIYRWPERADGFDAEPALPKQKAVKFVTSHDRFWQAHETWPIKRRRARKSKSHYVHTFMNGMT